MPSWGPFHDCHSHLSQRHYTIWIADKAKQMATERERKRERGGVVPLEKSRRKTKKAFSIEVSLCYSHTVDWLANGQLRPVFPSISARLCCHTKFSIPFRSDIQHKKFTTEWFQTQHIQWRATITKCSFRKCKIVRRSQVLRSKVSLHSNHRSTAHPLKLQ